MRFPHPYSWHFLWADLGDLGAFLGPSWAILGAVLGHLGAVLGHLGGRLGPSWGHLGGRLGYVGSGTRGPKQAFIHKTDNISGHSNSGDPLRAEMWGPVPETRTKTFLN